MKAGQPLLDPGDLGLLGHHLGDEDAPRVRPAGGRGSRAPDRGPRTRRGRPGAGRRDPAAGRPRGPGRQPGVRHAQSERSGGRRRTRGGRRARSRPKDTRALPAGVGRSRGVGRAATARPGDDGTRRRLRRRDDQDRPDRASSAGSTSGFAAFRAARLIAELLGDRPHRVALLDLVALPCGRRRGDRLLGGQRLEGRLRRLDEDVRRVGGRGPRDGSRGRASAAGRDEDRR